MIKKTSQILILLFILCIIILSVYSIAFKTTSTQNNIKKQAIVKKVHFKENFVTIIHTESIDYQKSQQIQAIKPIININKIKKLKSKVVLTVQEKKKKFINLLVPAINSVYLELDKRYFDIKNKMDANTSLEQINKLKAIYRAKSNLDLLKRLKPHPRSIALAQAAMESSWATSRFYKDANNIFGIWSFKKNEPRIAAGQTRGKKTIWIRKYNSVRESVMDYYEVIAKGYAFSELRTLRLETKNPYELVKKLHRYSEKGSKYGDELTSIIKYNKFYLYDK